MPAELDPRQQSSSVSVEFLGSLRPHEILEHMGFPLLYTAKTPTGSLLLLYFSEEREDAISYIASSTSAQKLSELKAGKLKLIDAVKSDWMWLVDFKFNEEGLPLVSDIWSVTPNALPEHMLPDPWVTLFEDLTPILELKAEGPELRELHTPTVVASYMAEVGKRAIKPIAEHVLGKKLGNYERSQLTPYLSPSLVEQEAASYRVAFRLDEELGLDPDITKNIADLLRVGIEYWAMQESRQMSIGDLVDPIALENARQAWEDLDQDSKSAIAQAMLKLAPPRRGPIKTMTVLKGAGAFCEGILFNREDSKAIADFLDATNVEDEARSFVGYVRALDLDKKTAVLRADLDSEEGGITIAFDEDLFDRVERHFRERTQVATTLDPNSHSKSWYGLNDIAPVGLGEEASANARVD